MKLRSLLPWPLAIALHVAAGAAAAQAELRLDADEALRASQAVLNRPVGEHVLLDRRERPVRLSDWRGKPLLVSFIYTGCFQVCPANTRALQESVERLQQRFGTGRFQVASIGFNQPADSPQAMKAFAAQHRIRATDWEFLSAPAPVVDAVTREFGFAYLATPAGFEHVLQVTLVDPSGRIVRQFYGDRADVEAMSAAMETLLAGGSVPPASAIANLVERVRLLCSVYDPVSGKYRLDYGLVLQLAGGATFLLALLLYLLDDWLARRAQRRLGGL